MKIIYIFLLGLLLIGCVPLPDQKIETHRPIVTKTITSIQTATYTQTSTPTLIATNTKTNTPAPTTTKTPPGSTILGEDPVLVGAGDIADCFSDGDEATANLLDGIPGTVFTTGDNAYPNGTASDFLNCYDSSWGRHKARTYPSPGNHDYNTDGAADYFDYFGPNAGDPAEGYYSYDLGAWHIIVLNSNIPVDAGSTQEQWLRADLAAHPVTCTLAYWHHPRFSSGDNHGSNEEMQPIWQALYEYGADVVLGGHDHTYERFAPQTPQGKPDKIRGIRQFVVGSGGRSHYHFGPPIANSEVRNDDTFGVLKLTLHADSYSWEFIPEAGKTFTDSGSMNCVTLEPTTSNKVITYSPTDDATVKLGSPNKNYGSNSELQVDNDPKDNFLIKFVVTGLNDQPILSAKLRLYNVNSSNTGGDLYRLANNEWLEDNVSWNTAPGTDSIILDSLGPVSKNTWYEIDLTSIIIGDGSYSFRMNSTDGDGADYVSKEGDAELAPQLIVVLGGDGVHDQ